MRITFIFGGFVTAVAAAFYPIFYYPLTHNEEYSKWLFTRAVTQQTVHECHVRMLFPVVVIHVMSVQLSSIMLYLANNKLSELAAYLRCH